MNGNEGLPSIFTGRPKIDARMIMTPSSINAFPKIDQAAQDMMAKFNEGEEDGFDPIMPVAPQRPKKRALKDRVQDVSASDTR